MIQAEDRVRIGFEELWCLYLFGFVIEKNKVKRNQSYFFDIF